ncbi:protein of unknown function [Burkholderia multivorans]
MRAIVSYLNRAPIDQSYMEGAMLFVSICYVRTRVFPSVVSGRTPASRLPVVTAAAHHVRDPFILAAAACCTASLSGRESLR